MKKFIFNCVFLLFVNDGFYSQEYSYQDYRHDHALLFKSERLLRQNKIDSLKLVLPEYKNRLGFKYYQYKALVANLDSDSSQYKYLDSAFMRGMTPLCIQKYIKNYDSAMVYRSFQKNYLKAYDLRLINVIDSIHYKDQEYRQQISIENKKKAEESNQKQRSTVDSDTKILIKTLSRERRLDSLIKLMKITDSTNRIKLNEIINQYGWPGAKLVGDYYCQRPAPDVSILFIHLGNTQREYQISNLKRVIELCKKHEENWDVAQSLLFGLHSKFSRDFSEFSFLKIQNDHLDKIASYFSVYKMTEMLIGASRSKIELKCASKDLYEELKLFMLQTCKQIPIDTRDNKQRLELGLPIPKELDESSFLFIEAPELPANVVQYKWSLK